MKISELFFTKNGNINLGTARLVGGMAVSVGTFNPTGILATVATLAAGFFATDITWAITQNFFLNPLFYRASLSSKISSYDKERLQQNPAVIAAFQMLKADLFYPDLVQCTLDNRSEESVFSYFCSQLAQGQCLAQSQQLLERVIENPQRDSQELIAALDPQKLFYDQMFHLTSVKIKESYDTQVVNLKFLLRDACHRNEYEPRFSQAEIDEMKPRILSSLSSDKIEKNGKLCELKRWIELKQQKEEIIYSSTFLVKDHPPEEVLDQMLNNYNFSAGDLVAGIVVIRPRGYSSGCLDASTGHAIFFQASHGFYRLYNSSNGFYEYPDKEALMDYLQLVCFQSGFSAKAQLQLFNPHVERLRNS